MNTFVDPKEALKNYLLGSLSASDFMRIIEVLEPVFLESGQVLYEVDKKMEYAFFPVTTIIYQFQMVESGLSTEIGIIGNEGLVGIGLFMGDHTPIYQANVLCKGKALRMKANDLLREFRFNGMFQALLLRFTMSLITQISQTAVCNRLHTIEQQLCRWLLVSQDRIGSSKCMMTQELISQMLGVRREGISVAIKKLTEKNLITHSRGTIIITDRRGLETNACECYKEVNKEYKRLLGRDITKIEWS